MRNTAMNTAFKPVVRVALVTALILLLPLLAMQFTEEVAWDLADFVVAGALLMGAGLTFELVAKRAAGSVAYRAAIGVAVAAALLLIWMNLAVGLVGDEDNFFNLMYVGVLAVGIGGSILTRLQPRGMSLSMMAMAFAQGLVAVVALIFGYGYTQSDAQGILILNGIFVVLFAGSAWLFWRAEPRQVELGEHQKE